MSIFKKIEGKLEEFKEKAEKNVYNYSLPLMKEFCECLRQIGVNASILEFESPESLGGLGYVKVEGRNIDLAQYDSHSTTHTTGSGSSRRTHTSHWYDSHYYLRVNVEGLENKLKAEAKPIKKGFFSREIVDYKWEGGELAQRLNADSELKSTLVKERPGEIRIDSIKNLQCVGIQVERTEEKTFPTREAFEAYDRIAQHIRNIISWRALESIITRDFSELGA